MNLRTPVVLLALLLLAPFAAAADPEPLSWSPHVPPTTANAVALAAEGRTLAAALAQPPAPNPTGGLGTARVVTTDLVVVDLEHGFAQNGANQAPPLGRTLVAVSRDGTTVVSVNNDTASDVGATNPASLRRTWLAYQRVEGGANFTGRTTWHNASLEGVPLALVVSDDGRRVAVASNLETELSLRGFQLTPGGFAPTFHYRTAGNLSALAADGSLTTLFAGANLPQGDAVRGVLLAMPFSAGIPSATHADSRENVTFRSVSASRDGARVAVGTADGRLLLFQGAGPGLPAPATLTLGATPVGPVAVSEDGRRVAALHGPNLTHADATGAQLEPLWNATTPRPAGSLAYNRTGGFLLVGVPGDALYAYADAGPEPLWRNPGDARSVQLQASGDLFALARGPTVLAFRVPRNLTVEHVAGGDNASAKLVRAGGTLLYELNVRNTGASYETVALEAPRQENLRVAFDPPTLGLRPNEVRRVNVTVEADVGFAGERAFNVTARALTSAARDETRVRLALQTAANVTLVLDRTDVVLQPGEPVTLLVGIQNRGNKDAAVGIRAVQKVSAGPAWSVAVDPPSLTLAPGAITTARLTVTPPADAPNGTSLSLTLSLEGQDVSDSATLTLRINPSVGIEVTATPRIKFVQPGRAAQYNVTVKNTGSVARAFEAWYDVLPSDGGQARSWAVDVPASEFRLEAGAHKTLAVRILAPADVTPDDRVSVRVSARVVPLNDTEAPVVGNVTLFANGEAPSAASVPADEDPIPGLGAPLLVAASLAAAGLLRRRRQ